MKRLAQILHILTFIGFSWLAMQVVHELGHVVVARLTGAEVTKVALHPLIISRTYLAENLHPLAVVWGGPLFGAGLPLALFCLAFAFRAPGLYLFRFFAGFCLVANGVYIGTGWLVNDEADPWVMTQNGSPVWLLVLFGLLTAPLGLYLWHRQGSYFGLAQARGRVNMRAALISAALFVVIAGAEVLRNVR
jgi:hypothetical protein